MNFNFLIFIGLLYGADPKVNIDLASVDTLILEENIHYSEEKDIGLMSKPVTSLNKYGKRFLQVRELNPNKKYSTVKITAEPVIDYFLNTRSKSDLFRVEILSTGDYIKNKFEISFENIYDIDNASIYILTNKMTYPIKSYTENGSIKGFINNKNLENFSILVLENQYSGILYRFRNEYFFEALKFGLESGLFSQEDLNNLDKNINIDRFKDLLELGYYNGNISYRDFYIVLKNTFHSNFKVNNINKKLFKEFRKNIDFTSKELVTYKDFIYIIRELICLD